MIQSSSVKKQRVYLTIFIILIIVTIVISMGQGSSSLSYDRLLPILLGKGTMKEEFILFSLRLPRIIITLLTGLALSLSGAILQGVTRNDLADPGLIGVNSGAGVAVTLFVIMFSIDAGNFVYVLPLAAFLGGLLTFAIIYLCSYQKQVGIHPMNLTLTGVGCSLALSGLMIIMISSAERTEVDFISKWLAGNIWGNDWPFIIAILPWLLVLIPFTLYKANRLNILGLSEPVAIGVGISIERERVQLLLAAVALAASAVSVAGSISFIGLMGPHIAKALVGRRHQMFLPIAIALGGWFLVLADTIGRNIVQPEGIPAGVMVSLIGAPYFIYLLLKKLP